MNTINDNAIQRMTLTAFEAASDASRWSVFVDDVRRCFGASSVYFWAPSVASEPDNVWWVESGGDPNTKLAYVRQWGVQDPWASHPMGHSRSTPGRCFIGSQILPWKELLGTGFYNDFGRCAGLKGVMSALVEDDSHPSVAPQTKLALFRDEGMPEFDVGQLRAFQVLQPALRRALHSYWAFQHLRGQASAVEQTLEAMPAPVFVLGRDGLVNYANRSAKTLEASGVVHASSGKVTRIAQLLDARLCELLKLAAVGISQEVGLWMPRANGSATAAMHLTRLAPESSMAGHWPRAEVLAMIQIGNASLAREARIQALSARCRLTPTELKVLTRLADGAAAQAVAHALCMGVSTVRTHIRHLLDKTHQRRVLDLLRLLGQ